MFDSQLIGMRRRALGLSIRDFAGRIGVSSISVRRLEEGLPWEPPMSSIVRTAEVLGLELHHLFGSGLPATSGVPDELLERAEATRGTVKDKKAKEVRQKLAGALLREQGPVHMSVLAGMCSLTVRTLPYVLRDMIEPLEQLGFRLHVSHTGNILLRPLEELSGEDIEVLERGQLGRRGLTAYQGRMLASGLRGPFRERTTAKDIMWLGQLQRRGLVTLEATMVTLTERTAFSLLAEEAAE